MKFVPKGPINRIPDKDLFILQSQYHGCRLPGDTRSQAISDSSIEVICRRYSCLMTPMANTTHKVVVYSVY